MVPTNKISLIRQDKILRKKYPNSTSKRDDVKKILIWDNYFTPSLLSETYKVRLIYKEGYKVPKVFVLEPKKLPLAHGEKKLPHVHSTNKQILCLFYPKYKAWTSRKLIADYIVPWISEWLYFYEIWVGTGEWLGGGIEHD